MDGQGWVELAGEASCRAGWWGLLGEFLGKDPRLDRRSQGKAQAVDLGEGGGAWALDLRWGGYRRPSGKEGRQSGLTGRGWDPR